MIDILQLHYPIHFFGFRTHTTPTMMMMMMVKIKGRVLEITIVAITPEERPEVSVGSLVGTLVLVGSRVGAT